jgi:hypothetical protein
MENRGSKEGLKTMSYCDGKQVTDPIVKLAAEQKLASA